MIGVHYIDLAHNPSVILDLTRAQLASPKLLAVTSEHIRPQTPDGKAYTKPAIFRQIQQYLHDHTYHMVRQDRIEFFGWSEIADLNKEFGEARVAKSLDVIINQLTAEGRQELADAWVKDRAEGKCLNGRNLVFDQSCVLGRKRRGKPALQCGDETTVAAAMCVLAAGVKLEQLMFIGSSFHTLVFVDYGDGYLFDSKMLLDKRSVKKVSQGTTDYFTHRLGEIEWLVTADGYCDFTFDKNTLGKQKLKQMITKLQDFVGQKLPI